ncbi:MAG: DUF2235 domain-containing protein [Tepidiforma sp.]
MTLAKPIPLSAADPSLKEIFFTKEDDKTLARLELREHPPVGDFRESCTENLFLGFFFDGTRNNYAVSEETKDESYSNVARLFDAYPGQTIAPRELLRFDIRWPDEARYPNFFRIYIPGVGTPFEEIGDSGRGWDRTAGAAFARWGERRLVWALCQAINAVNRYFHRQTLITPEEIRDLSGRLDLGPASLNAPPGPAADSRDGVRYNTTWHLDTLLGRLHESIRYHIPDPVTGQPKKIDPGKVGRIYVSVVGFSRGAAAARAFANWFLRLCQLDAQRLRRGGLSLGSFPVSFDFLGLFDTVASVGLAASTVAGDGHGAWAHNELLRIPPQVGRTLHLVAAHEVRRSFPLDSISWEGRLPARAEEIVFPGVHSDVGGGYRPGEQGRGVDPNGADMLSRIPLAVMYREARLSGMPLKLERARTAAHERFRIARETITAFNAYLAACHTREGTLREIMREQMGLSIRWRRLRHGTGLRNLASTRRAAQEDRNDLLSADLEFAEELRLFEEWRHLHQKAERDGLLAKVSSPYFVTRACLKADCLVDRERSSEWELLLRDWDEPLRLPAAIVRLFDDYVHDSRAWFKISGPEAEEWAAELRHIEFGFRLWEEHIARQCANDPGCKRRFLIHHPHYALVKAYRKAGYRVPPMITQGREPFSLGGGYLRLRRIYSGPDGARLTQAPDLSRQVAGGPLPGMAAPSAMA